MTNLAIEQGVLWNISNKIPAERDASADYSRDHFFGSQARGQSESNSDIHIQLMMKQHHHFVWC
jgi:predicted nucleotidyltransferase